MNLFTNKFQNPANSENVVCREACAQLTSYLDNTLSARNVWDVEKHLAACPACAEVLRQMRATVQLLHTVERLDTGDDFMAKLHARLDGLEPEPARRGSPGEWLRDVCASFRASLTSRRASGFGLGMAAAGLAAFAFVTHLPTPMGQKTGATIAVPASAPTTQSLEVHENLQRNVALTANDPLGDVAAEYLESAESGRETSLRETNSAETNGS